MKRKLVTMLLLSLFFFPFAHAEEESEFEIAADEITHIKEGNQIIAQGNVEIRYMDYILRAERLVYFVDEERLVSDDAATITHKDGTTTKADSIDVTRDLHNIAAKNFRMMFPTGAHFTAEAAKRKYNGPLRLKNARYSSCKLCYNENGEEKPLVWSANANNITHNQETKTIAYKSLWLEMFDVPVFYLPYFYHPDPSVKRKTGFLFPSFGRQSDLGQTIEFPFYFALSDYNDLTLTPKFASKHNPILSGQYRHNFTNGTLQAGGMITDNDDKGTRAHLNIESKFDINDTWRTNLDFEWVSDDTVLRFYDLDGKNRAWIESKGTLEGFTRDSNLSFNLLSFDDLRADVDDDTIPTVIPYIEYNRTISGLPMGTYFTFHSNILDIERNDDNRSTRRLATTMKYAKPYTSPFGALFNFSANIATNIYSIDNYEYATGQEFSGAKMLFVPNLMMDARYPFAKKQENSYQVIEPIVQVILAPNSDISDKIPNEDSQDFEFEDTSVLQNNHFAGYDRYNIGSRINYGLNWTTYGQKTGRASVFLGQSYRFQDSFEYPKNSGFSKNLSDIVGRVSINPSSLLYLNYRFRFDKDNLEARHNELRLTAGPPAFRLHLNYLFLTSTTKEYDALDDREEIFAAVSSQLTKHWKTTFFMKRDLEENRNVEAGAHIYYDDECFLAGFSIKRSYTYDRDYSDGLSLKFNVVFKGMSNSSNLYKLRDLND